MNRHTYQWNQTGNSEIDAKTYGNLVYDKGMIKNQQWNEVPLTGYIGTIR